jgi:hypothetical protein
MKIPLHIAEKLLLLSKGERLAASSARHQIIEELVEEGILERTGRIKKTLWLPNSEGIHIYLQNHYEIRDLALYIQTYKKGPLSRAELASVAADTKLSIVRTFKGFLVNCCQPTPATLNKEPFVIQPKEGMFHFIYDYEHFIPSADITIVGIENPENFRWINRQQYLFSNIKPLFVSRYPQSQSKDLLKWLAAIDNPYLHFGDFDFAGIGIYQNEFKKRLKKRAKFYVPDGIEALIRESGIKKRYNQQIINFDINTIEEEAILHLIALIHQYKKGLDQEILIKG